MKSLECNDEDDLAMTAIYKEEAREGGAGWMILGMALLAKNRHTDFNTYVHSRNLGTT